jgi:hypothetical protein
MIGFINMYVLAGMQNSSNPCTIESQTSQFPWGNLSRDVQELIREHTATIFSVESEFTMRFRFPEVGWCNTL